MDYELAKELKDAGFPQDGATCFDDPYTCCAHSMYYKQGIAEGGGRNEEPYFPTLEELIEACMESVPVSLQLWWDKERGWLASYNNFSAGTNDAFTGPTPTEAVARLWLALKRKSPIK